MKRFGLIGKKLNHSFSEQFFNRKFKIEKIENCCYKLYEMQNVIAIKQFILDNNISGLNVTIPFKEDIIKHLDELSEEAHSIQAVNCIKVKNNKLIGYNTDYQGFHESIKPLLKKNHKKALILGTGGASKAIEYSLKKLNIEYLFVSRNGKLRYQDLNQKIIYQHQIIINTTPLGTFPNINQCPEIPYSFLNNQHLLYDLTYNPNKSMFLKKGEQFKSKTKNGLEMLEIQALRSWQIWNK